MTAGIRAGTTDAALQYNGVDVATFDANGLASTGLRYTPSGTGAVGRTVSSKLQESVSVKDFGAVGDGVTDDTVNFQKAIDALPANTTLVAKGIFKTSSNLYLKGDRTYDFSAATFTGHSQINVGNVAEPTTVHSNILWLAGVHRPDATAAVYPAADVNPVAVILGTNITIINPRIYPKQGSRAISIQTDTSVGTGPTYLNIDKVVVAGLEIYGDGNAVDGLDITSAGADGMIKNVTVEGVVYGCKRGGNISTGNNLYNFDNFNIDLTIDGATEIGFNLSRCKNSRLNIKSVNCTKAGVSLAQIANCVADIYVSGTGGGLTNGLVVVDGTGTSQNTVSAYVKGAWTTGIAPQSQDCIYPNIEIDGAVLGIDTAGYRSTWGNVTLKNCTTNVDNLDASTDRWNMVVSQGAGSGPTIIKRGVESANGVDQLYGLDAVNGSTITIAAAGTASPFGSVAAFSGMLVVNGTAGTGDPAMFLMGGAASYLVGGASATYSATSGTASKINVYYNGSNYVTIQNNTAGSVTLRVFAVRMRNSA